VATVIVGAGALAACAAILGLDDVGYTPPPLDDASAPIGPRDKPDVDLTPPPPPPRCDAGPNDLAGCYCATPDASRTCFHGAPGDASACNAPGSQTCEGTKWTACRGGSLPEASTDLCYDGVDNECNGTVDDGCLCSPASDHCVAADGGTFGPTDYTWWTVPARPRAGQPYDLLVVTKNMLAKPVSLHFGGACQQKEAACPQAGSRCPGWYVARFRVGSSAAGPHQVKVNTQDTNGNCSGNDVLASLAVITVDP
jgi:hypothetical protein